MGTIPNERLSRYSYTKNESRTLIRSENERFENTRNGQEEIFQYILENDPSYVLSEVPQFFLINLYGIQLMSKYFDTPIDNQIR